VGIAAAEGPEQGPNQQSVAQNARDTVLGPPRFVICLVRIFPQFDRRHGTYPCSITQQAHKPGSAGGTPALVRRGGRPRSQENAATCRRTREFAFSMNATAASVIVIAIDASMDHGGALRGVAFESSFDDSKMINLVG